MHPSIVFRWAALLGVGLAAPATSARAEFFEYNTTVSISNVSPAGSTVVGNGTTTVTDTTPGGTVITLTGLNSADPTFHENGNPPGTDIVLANISAATTPTTPFEAVGFNFDFTVTLTDFKEEAIGGVPTGTGTIHVVGRLDGSVGAGRKVNLDQLTNYATVPGNGFFQVGATQYRLTLNSYVPPGTTGAGIFGAHVVAQVPEPSSYILMGIGLVGLWGFRCRKRLQGRVGEFWTLPEHPREGEDLH